MREKVTCGVCQAELEFPEGADVMVCPYCGEVVRQERVKEEAPDWSYEAEASDWPDDTGRATEGFGTKLSGERWGGEQRRHRTPDGQILDSWEEIFDATYHRYYRDYYRIGDTKLLDLGPAGKVRMQIVAFDTDERADGTGKAPITWLSVDLLRGRWAMNYRARRVEFGGETMYDSGTGSVGGWSGSLLRGSLNEDMHSRYGRRPLRLPEKLKKHIVKVKKSQTAWRLSVNFFNERKMTEFEQKSEELLWIPSYDEVVTRKGVYAAACGDESARVKRTAGSGVARGWWLRDAADCEQYYGMTAAGEVCTVQTNELRGVCLGFCTE